MKIFLFSFFLIIFIATPKISTAQIVFPKCKNKICFEPFKIIAGKKIHIRGVELLEYFKLDLYTAALYTPTEAASIDTVLSNAPKSLILYYHRNIKKEWMIRASRDRIKSNPANNMDNLESRLKQLDETYQNVRKGDRYELRYEPGKGTSLILNGKLQTVIPGEDFQRAFFGVWFSELPLNKKLRDRLLQASE